MSNNSSTPSFAQCFAIFKAAIWAKRRNLEERGQDFHTHRESQGRRRGPSGFETKALGCGLVQEKAPKPCSTVGFPARHLGVSPLLSSCNSTRPTQTFSGRSPMRPQSRIKWSKKARKQPHAQMWLPWQERGGCEGRFRGAGCALSLGLCASCTGNRFTGICYIVHSCLMHTSEGTPMSSCIQG